MQNVFDRAKYPAREPRSSVAGDRWVWQRIDIAEVYPTDTYSLAYRFTSQADTSSTQAVNAVEDGGVYYLEVEPATTELFATGAWAWEAVITRTSDSKTAVVDRGFFEVTASSTASHTLKVLQAIRATIEGTASEDQSRIEIAGRVLERRSISELLALEKEYAKRWQGEQAAALRASGRKTSQTLIGLRA